ncbi:hypothetical protein ACFT8W_17505 [Streptomyces hygroscopicus]|uniref:hypothetical protein n=1 Tax=Streptomyces hygroscopicus TaxID=1912 RepID=UPI00363DEEB3
MDSSTSNLVKRFGTPLYVYRLPTARAAALALSRALPEQTQVLYSVRANPHPRLVAEFVRGGLGCEVASTAELKVALAAGLPPHRCLFTVGLSTVDDISLALLSGVHRFSVDSLAGLSALEAAARMCALEAEYLIRLNDLGPANSESDDLIPESVAEFGFSPDSLHTSPMVFRASSMLTPVGFRILSGGNVFDTGTLMRKFDRSLELAARILREARIRPYVIDVGGGFAAPFAKPGRRPVYAGMARHMCRSLDRHLPGWRAGQPVVAFASGRYLVAECGILLTRVVDTVGGYAALDADASALGGAAGQGRVTERSWTAQAGSGAMTHEFFLTGSPCTPSGTACGPWPPRRPRVGDILEIPNVGAYGLGTRALATGAARPVEVVVDDGDEVVSVRPAEAVAGEIPRA